MRVGKNRLTMHIVIRMSFVLFIAGAHHGYAQRTSGFIPFHRLGLSYQRAFGVDVGLIVYNTRYGYQRKSFYDLSAGVESLFAHHVAFVPKVNVDFGVPLTLSKGSTLGAELTSAGIPTFAEVNGVLPQRSVQRWGQYSGVIMVITITFRTIYRAVPHVIAFLSN